jgi:hypothetical protein
VTPTDFIVSQAQRLSDWWSPPGEGEAGEADGARQREMEAAVRARAIADRALLAMGVGTGGFYRPSRLAIARDR